MKIMLKFCFFYTYFVFIYCIAFQYISKELELFFQLKNKEKHQNNSNFWMFSLKRNTLSTLWENSEEVSFQWVALKSI